MTILLAKTIKRYVCAWSLVLCVCSSTAKSSEVTIFTDVVRDFNGQQKVPDGLFGVTAYNGSDILQSPEYFDVVKDSGFRWVGLVASLNWILPPDKMPDGFPESFKGWAQSQEAKDRLKKPIQVFGGVNVPKNIISWNKLGIVPMLYVRGFPQWMQDPDIPPIPHYPKDYNAAAIVITEYVKWLKNAYPDLEWIHIGNEPNAKFWKAKKNGADYAQLFTTIAKSVHAAEPSLKIGGPALCWGPSWPPSKNPKKRDWYTWEEWTMPLIQTAGDDLDFFDFHIYSIKNPDIALEEVQAVCNAMWLKSNKRKPVIISEAGSYLTPEETENVEVHWKRRIKPWQDMIVAFLEKQPDKVVSLQMHDLLAQAKGEFRLIESPDPKEQNDFYRMFQLWSPFSGTRIRADVDNPNVRCLAAVNKNKLVIALVNTTANPQDINLKVFGKEQIPPREKIEVRSAKVLGIDDAASGEDIAEGMQDAGKGGVGGDDYEDISFDTKRKMQPLSSKPWQFIYETSTLDALPERFSLDSRETKVFSIPFAKGNDPSQVFSTREYYGDKVHVNLDYSKSEISFSIPCKDIDWGKAINPRLSIGMVGGHAGDEVSLKAGNTEKTIGTPWFQQIELNKPVQSEGQNELVVTFRVLKRAEPEKLPRLLRVTSVSLQVDYEQ